MQFNSIHFSIFFATVFIVYWSLGQLRYRWQNAWLLVCNLVFYSCWDYRFLSLLFAGTLIDYLVGIGFLNTKKKSSRHLLLGTSLTVNLGILAYFKYFNFFLESFSQLTSALGLGFQPHTLAIILPLGISFYTFQRMTYAIEIHRERMTPTPDFLAFCAFSSFFPLVTAGPIERAPSLLPQFLKPRSFHYERSKDALRQILWGLFKKIVIADNLADPVNKVFADYSRFSGLDLAAGAFLFAIQVYADFSGYSDMAIGCGRLLGFSIRRNFAYPYFSRNIGEFWRKWHISMSSWFRDYIYTPLSWKLGLQQKWRRMFNIVVTFTVSGLWHGSNWTFVLWGVVNGLYFAPLMLGRSPEHEGNIVAEGRLLPTWRDSVRMVFTFILICLSWVLFRADSVGQAFEYLLAMVQGNWLVWPREGEAILAAVGLLTYEWFRRDKVHGLVFTKTPFVLRWAAYLVVVFAILVFGSFSPSGFFYVQF